MNWQDIKGISTITDFSSYYMENGLIHRATLFNKPDRKKWGYLWEIDPEYIGGVEKNVGENFLGMLITNDLDARVFQGLFNTVFFKMNKAALIEGVRSLAYRPQGKVKLTNAEIDKLVWDTYYEIFTTLYSSDYIPLKKYFSSPVNTKIWIPLFPEYSHMDKLARKGYYQLIKWIIGNEPIIIELPQKYEVSWIWESVILEDGPMGNPELLFMEDFAVEFPGSIKYIPKDIVEKIGVQPLGDLDYFGISFH